MKEELVFPLEILKVTKEADEMSLDDICSKAHSILGSGKSWVMAEYPNKFIFQEYGDEVDASFLKDAYKVIFFGNEAELCWQKSNDKGFVRIIQDGLGTDEYQKREVKSLLRKEKGKLLHAEYFQPDPDSGFLIPRFTRLCGIVQNNQAGSATDPDITKVAQN